MQFLERQNKNEGFAALLTVMIISVAILIISLNASSLGLGELELGTTSSKGGEVLSISNGCMEDSLNRIRVDNTYGIGSGDMNLTVSNGSCTINILDSGSERTVTVIGTDDQYYKKIEVLLVIGGNGKISITNWVEKDD